MLGWGGPAPGGTGGALGDAGAAGGTCSGFNWAGGLGMFIWPAEAAMVEGR